MNNSGPFCKECGNVSGENILCGKCSLIESQAVLNEALKDIENFSQEDCVRTGQLLNLLSKHKELSLSYIKNRYGVLPLNMKWIRLKVTPNQPTLVSLTDKGKLFIEVMNRVEWTE